MTSSKKQSESVRKCRHCGYQHLTPCSCRRKKKKIRKKGATNSQFKSSKPKK